MVLLAVWLSFACAQTDEPDVIRTGLSCKAPEPEPPLPSRQLARFRGAGGFGGGLADIAHRRRNRGEDENAVACRGRSVIERAGPRRPRHRRRGSLRETGESVTAGLEPVADSARRAVGLFFRELPPMEANPKTGF